MTLAGIFAPFAHMATRRSFRAEKQFREAVRSAGPGAPVRLPVGLDMIRAKEIVDEERSGRTPAPTNRIELATARRDGDDIRLNLTVDGQARVFYVKPAAAASMIGAIASAIASETA